MANKETDIKKILDLKSHEGIAGEIADRQLKVITKAYEFLSKKENTLIYIADEVGLGKTYIGLGIAALFRHFSRKPERHYDIMIVPKKNLQDKWLKELRNFAGKNYLEQAGHYGYAAAQSGIIRDRLQPVRPGNFFSIFRTTSFSSLITSRQQLRRYFQYEVFGNDQFCAEVLAKAYDLKYFNNGNKGPLLRLVACLMNAASEKAGCLIVDEAHNYKYGPGGEKGDGSARNQVTARFLGAIRDREILKLFPEVRKKMKFPLAEKVICLSATPKDRKLMEIKNQLACFTEHHLLENCENADDIKEMLPRFLVRGNMEYELEGITYSRNQCRYEHRSGNVVKIPDAGPIVMQDNFENIFWQLLQYQSIRKLAQKANASFEIGMLTGFESYQADMDKKLVAMTDDEGNDIAGKIFEYPNKRGQKDSEDANIIRAIVSSYKETFGNEPPPHPKLTRLEDEIISQFGRQEKSLIFVRRIATVDELQTRLLHRYDNEIIARQYLQLEGKWAKFKSGKVKVLLEDFAKQAAERKRKDFLAEVCGIGTIAGWWDNNRDVPQEAYLHEFLEYCFDQNDGALRELISFRQQKKKFNRGLAAAALHSIRRRFSDWLEELKQPGDPDLPEEEDQTRSDSFFKVYFKRRQKGYAFKQKIYRENWFELNIYQLMAADHGLSPIALNGRASVRDGFDAVKDRRPHQRFKDYQDAFKQALTIPSHHVQGKRGKTGFNYLTKSTFLTELLLKCCKVEWAEWINKYRQMPAIELIRQLDALNSLLQSVFQNGSGLLPAFVADARGKNFAKELIMLLETEDAPFNFVLKEVKTIIKDYGLIISINFQDADARKISEVLKNLSPVVGASGQDKNRSAIAARFRMPGYPYALIATDIFHEGEDLHSYCQEVYHYGIAWNPSGIEQRTGRIDRINSLSYRKLNESGKLCFENKVQVFYPYLSHSVEVSQVAKLLGHIDRFVRDFNDIDKEQRFDSEVALSQEVTASDIPQATQELLVSKYDVDNFTG